MYNDSENIRFNCVVGIRRSGTSIMMLILRTAGVPILGQKYAVHTNFETKISDKELYGNPNGYWEMGSISCITGLKEHHLKLGLDQDVIKVVSDCLYFSNQEAVNKIIIMKRSVRKIISSMMKSGLFKEHQIEDYIKKITVDTKRTLDWIDVYKKEYIVVEYENLLKNPIYETKRVCEFLGRGDYTKGYKVVDKKLNRSKELEGDYEGLRKLESIITNIK